MGGATGSRERAPGWLYPSYRLTGVMSPGSRLACHGLGRDPRQMPQHIGKGVSRRREARDLNCSLARLPVPDESMSPARRGPGSEIDVVRALGCALLSSRLYRRSWLYGRVTRHK